MTIPGVLIEPSQSYGPTLERAQDETLYEWVVDELLDSLDIEKQLTKTLQRMAKAARAADIRQALARHLGTTRDRIDLLRGVLSDRDRAAADAQHDTDRRSR